jgi:PPK2 family polyphosphate:nucleotide phosphotransferase
MERYRIHPEHKISLHKDFDPDDLGNWKGEKDGALARMAELRQELDQLQEVLYAEHKHKVLVVLQAMDTAGKDGTIRSVFDGTNPQGVKVASFKVPTPIEADHDFLWRVHAQAPGKGDLVVFNRSHYEQVLVVRVHKLEPEEQWRPHYAQICDFERMLTETGTTILKFFLHVSLDEQKERLLERIDTPEKQWKFSPGDLPERKLWPDYMKAYEEMLNRTSTEWAPWYVVPANHNWYRNLAVASVLVNALKKLDMKYPAAVHNLGDYRRQLETE